jgi:hypothetical protein
MNQGRSLDWVIAACSVALLAPLLGPLLTGRVFVYDDLLSFHLPMRYLYQQALWSGDSVLWTPSIFAGVYLHGEGQVGLFHPFHQALYRLFPLGTAFNLEVIASYVAAFAGMFWLLRRLRCSHAAALFGAMLFSFGGFNLLHLHHVNMVAVVAHIPWLLAAADVLIVDERKRARTLAFVAMSLIPGSELLLGFPQAVWWSMMALAAFSLLRAGETKRWRRLWFCVVAVAIGVLLGGIQLLPTADAAAQSMRAGVAREFALTYSLHPLNLLQLWSPYVFNDGVYSTADTPSFHEFGIYSGAIMPVALAWVWIRRRALHERRALVVGCTVFTVVMLVLALGRYGGLATLLTFLPVLESLRAPARYIVLAQLALAILAAVAFDDLRATADDGHGATPGRQAGLWIPTALGVLTTLVLNARLIGYDGNPFARAGTAAAGVAILAAVTLLVHMAGRRARWALPVLVLVTAVDLGLWGIRFVYQEAPRTIAEAIEGVPDAPSNPADRYAAPPIDGPYRSDLLVMRGYRLTRGYLALLPATRHPLNSGVAMQLSGMRWVITRDGRRRPAEGGAERVRLLDARGNPATGDARLVVDRPGRLVVHVDAPDRRSLAFTERFHDGWSATIDGVPRPMVRVEGDFLGCVLEKGVQRVTLRFMPRSFVYGSIVSGFGVVLLAGILIVRWR